MADDAADILSPLNVPNPVKKMAWDVYQVTDKDTFEKRLSALPIPTPVKARLWEKKYGGQKTGQLTSEAHPISPPPAAPGPKIGPGPTAGERVGRTLYESIPTVTGAAGATLAAAPFVAATPATGGASDIAAPSAAVAGAGAGGLVGRYIQWLLQKTAGGRFGIPPSRETPGQVLGQAGGKATGQMEQQMAGEVIAAPLGFIRRGGFLRTNPEVMSTLREDRALGTKLSGPEIASGTPAGDIGKKLQTYGSGSFAGGAIQRKAREQGSAGATKAIDDALSLLGHPGVGGGPTEVSKGSAYAAREFLGQQLEAAADAAPAVDVRAVKAQAAKELEQGIVQHLKAVPDVADPKLAAQIRMIRNDPTLIQRMPRPELTRLADAILEKFKSPSLQILKRIVGMEDHTAARGVWDELQALGAKGRPADELYAKTDAQRVATFLKGQLREALGTSAPDFGKVLGQYRDLARGDYLRESIVLGGKPAPTSEAAANEALTSMATRLRKAVETGRIARDFGDPNGKQVISNVSRVAKLLEKRTPQTQGMIRQIFEISRVLGASLTAAGQLARGTGVGTTAMTTAAVWEALPDFLVWVMHDPRATAWFIEGSTAKNPSVSAAATVRLMELYRQTHTREKQEQQK